MDIDNYDFAHYLYDGEPDYKYNLEFQNTEFSQKTGIVWTTQKEHCVVWFFSQLGTGSGKFKRKRANHSARQTYMKLQSPEMLLYIACRSNVPESLIIKAYDEVIKFCNSNKSQGDTVKPSSLCKIIRNVISFDDCIVEYRKKNNI